MVIIYKEEGCPYAVSVIKKLDELALPYKELNMGDKEVAEDLVKRGGKFQSPYLVDESTGVEMYESADIVAYLERQYGGDVGAFD